MVANVIDGSRLRRLKALACFSHDGRDQKRNQFAHQFGAAPVIVEIAVGLEINAYACAEVE